MPNDIVTRAIDAVSDGTHLTADHASAVLDEIMEGRSGEVQTAAFLIALRTKGETVAELVGLARTMRRLAAHVESDRAELVDTAGTGGVLEALGVEIELGPEDISRCIDEIGFGFMFAPRHHAAMKHVVPVRKELAVRTIFNFLGPLTNPAGASRQLLGVSDRSYQETIAEALVGLGCERALVVTGADGVDELTLSAETRVIEVADGRTEEWFVKPEEYGIEHRSLDAFAGGMPEDNARTIREAFEHGSGPAHDVIVLNAGAAIMVGGAADDLAGGIERAREVIASGAAMGVLDSLAETTRRLAGAAA
jgi:anthranilate phosphoribosyltransferase